jgi:hypothetical protein
MYKRGKEMTDPYLKTFSDGSQICAATMNLQSAVILLAIAAIVLVLGWTLARDWNPEAIATKFFSRVLSLSLFLCGGFFIIAAIYPWYPA